MAVSSVPKKLPKVTASASSTTLISSRRSNKNNPRYSLKEAVLAYGLLSPAVILMLVFTFFPVAFGFYISLYQWRLSPQAFLGLGNYARALKPGSELWPALSATLTYSILSVPLQLGIALVLAYLLFQKIRGKPFFRVTLPPRLLQQAFGHVCIVPILGSLTRY